MLESLAGQQEALQPQLEAFGQDVSQLKEWASGLTEKRAQLQTSLTALRVAVGKIEERTSAIAKDFANKVKIVLLSFVDFCPILCSTHSRYREQKSSTVLHIFCFH